MSFGDFLSSALTVGTQAAGAHEKAVGDRGQRETQDLLQRIQLARQANQDALNQQLTRSTIALHGAQTTKANQEPPPDVQIVDGQLVDKKTATARPIAGYQKPVDAPKTTTTTTRTLRISPHRAPTDPFGVGAGAGATPTKVQFPRPEGWSDEQWTSYLKDTNQVP